MFQSQLQQTGSLILNKAIFARTGTYNDMVQRPYQTNFNDAGIVNQFYEATMGGSVINPNTISGLANQFVRPSAQSTQGINIDNGWSQPRFRFILDVTQVDTFGRNHIRKIIQGYTDSDDAAISPDGQVHPNPNLMLYFNNVISLRETVTDTPHGRQTQTFIAEASHLVRGNYEPSLDLNQTNLTYTMTPQDVFSTMSRNHLSSSVDGEIEVHDTGTTFSMHPIKKSKRSNGSPTHYLSDILKSYNDTTKSISHYDPVDELETFGKAGGAVKENGVTDDSFLSLMLENVSGFADYGSATYQHLNQTLGNLDQVAVFVMDTDVQRNYSNANIPATHQTGQTEHWMGSTTETVWATALSNSIPSLMMDLMITKVSFMTTNRIAGKPGSYETSVVWAESFVENLDISPYLNTFINRLELEILNGLSQNHLVDFELEVHADIIGDTRISISIQGQPHIQYATPSFCDSLITPILSNNSDNLVTMSHDLHQLASGLTEDTTYLSNGISAQWKPGI